MVTLVYPEASPPVNIVRQYGVESCMPDLKKESVPLTPGEYTVTAEDGETVSVDVYVHDPTGKLCVWSDDILNVPYCDAWQSYDYAGHVCVEWVDSEWQRITNEDDCG